MDRHGFCAREAAQGRCSEIPGYMIMSCCASCDPYINASSLINPKVRCQRDFLNISRSMAWRPGDVDRTFAKVMNSTRWASAQPRLLSSPPKGPWVVVLNKFLSASECDALIDRTEQLGFQSSKIETAKNSFGELVATKEATRTSSSTHCFDPTCFRDPVVQRVKRRVQALTGVQDRNFEVQFVKYNRGEYFKPHLDVKVEQLEDAAGLRVLTVLLYLSDVENGGATTFPELGLEVVPRRGAALLFPNVLDEDLARIDERTSHAGMPVDEGVKRAANVWIHQYDISKAYLWGCQ